MIRIYDLKYMIKVYDLWTYQKPDDLLKINLY